MATQCRSSKCTAERKGFRRELDSWRHKLIHCVGFESILEGIYGPRLLQDLNIFDECEPETVDDWSMDANCSFCNLQLEKLNDHCSAMVVPGSPTPAETPSPQGLSTFDKLQCQADRFLHAIFRKKEFPQSCNSSIPLVAKELMRKMIQRFALEYASKSQAQDSLNSLNDNSEVLPHQTDSDGPLDLTISRGSEALQEVDGVLDLSKKSCSSDKASIQQKDSGSLGPNEEDQPRLEKEDDSKAPEACKVTVLEKVLSLFCSRHRLLLYHILMDMQEDYKISVTLGEGHRGEFKAEPICCHPHKKLLNESPTLALNGCSVTAGTCCGTACRPSSCTIPPVCVSLKNLHNHSCQIAMACVGPLICSNSTVGCSHSKIPLCHCRQNGNHPCINFMRDAPITLQNNCNSHDRGKASRSPSPPPLSPKPLDTGCKMTIKTSILQIQECKAPPALLPRKPENEHPPLHSRSPEKHCDKFVSQTQKENDQCGSLIGDLMERVTEKLKSIQPSEREQTLLNHGSQLSETKDDTHLTEIITTVLHNSSDKDYNLDDLLQQHVATGQRSPQTRSRRRLEILDAMSKSPDLSSSRRQSLQIKRDLARLSPSRAKRKIGSERSQTNVKLSYLTRSSGEPPNGKIVTRGSNTGDTKPIKGSIVNLNTHTQNEKMQNGQENQKSQSHDIDLSEDMPNDEMVQSQNDCHRKVKRKTCKDKTLQVGRSRRNIVPPQRFSSYITEPRKMYFATCSSESIFVKHSSIDNAETALCSTEETAQPSNICDKQPFIPKDINQGCDMPLKVALQQDNLLQIESLCQNENAGKNPLKKSPRKRQMRQNSTSPLKRSHPHRTRSLDNVSISPTDTMSNSSIESVQHAKESKRGLKYCSPIKLMFVSSVIGEEGEKYTLKAATAGLNSHEDIFDPCVESSWAGSTLDEKKRVIELAQGKTLDQCSPVKLLISGESENPETIQIAHETSPVKTTHQTSPVKRRPGRPKKLGPHIVKSVKRPIGRPPKPKTTDSSDSTGKTGSNAVDHRAIEMSCKDDANKNLKITIVYGRSRRSRRVVSEDIDNFSPYQNDYEESNNSMHSKTCSEKTSINDQMTKEQLKDLKFVMPVKEKKCTMSSNSNIKCQRQNDTSLTVSRKPGRPAKVKISGISVTVTSESPRQRKIHIKRHTKDPHLLRRSLVEFEPSKEQKTIKIPTEIQNDAPEQCSLNSRLSPKPVRHSVRERKPSIHLLHSVATARSCALVRRSRKLLLSKASSDAGNSTKSKEEPPNNALSTKTKNVSRMKDIVRFSAVSVDSVFSPNEGFRWWTTSASPETINEELARRIRLMSSTWVSDVFEANKAEIKFNPKPKTSKKLSGSAKNCASGIKMLFEKNYDIEKLCSWFMQTTETQSLAIVKKASVKNPKEVFYYNPSRPNSKVNVCPSPQAERLRKHVKKFAKVVPKSPVMHKQAQETLYKARRLQAKRKLFNTEPFKLRNDIGQQLSRSKCKWVAYRTALLRAKLKFQTRPRKAFSDKSHKLFSGQIRTMTKGARTGEPLKEMHSFVNKTPTAIRKMHNSLNHSIKNPAIINVSRKMLSIPKSLNRTDSKAWSPESLKKCRVFLKNINSPNTKSTTEECNICTVKLCDVSSEDEENKKNEDIIKGGAVNSTEQLPSSLKCQGTRGRKRKKWKSPSPPAKMLRQSRSSRGVLGARWCDFVLGSLK